MAPGVLADGAVRGGAGVERLEGSEIGETVISGSMNRRISAKMFPCSSVVAGSLPFPS